jgi:hypothetical protein
MGYVWLFVAFLFPIVVAIQNGSTYIFAFSVTGVGVVLYFLNIFLIRWFIRRWDSAALGEGYWEYTAGMGVVPKWVSVIGLFGLGFIPSGLIVTLLLWLDFVVDRS